MEADLAQLADIEPKVDQPLRVKPPANAPLRSSQRNQDEIIRESAFSPTALASSQSILSNARGRITLDHIPGSQTVNTDNDAQINTALRDFFTLAFSSSRAGKKDVEASAYLAIAIIRDNQKKLKQAVENYQTYLNICEEIGDVDGQLLAINSIGVNYIHLACPETDAGILKGKVYDEDYVRKAIQHHEQHFKLADNGGKFIASTNLGLSYALIGEITQSARHHQNALRFAIKMQTIYGQSIAVGNLGMLAKMKGDYSTARTCLEQHLQLVQAMHHFEAEVNAWCMLSELCVLQEKLDQCIENLIEARRVAGTQSLMNQLRRIHCLIGRAQGLKEFRSFGESLLSRSNP